MIRKFKKHTAPVFALVLFAITYCFISSPARAFAANPFDACDYTVKVKDGSYEFVWKPTGAHRPEAVLVLPSRFKGFIPSTDTLTVRSVTIFQNEPLKKLGVMPMKSNGICEPGGECLNRPSFAHPKLSGKALSRRYGEIRLRVVSNVENHIHCTRAFDPKLRQD